MTFFSSAQHIARGSRRRRRSHLIPIMLGGAIAACAIAAGRLFAVADLGNRGLKRSGAVAGERRRARCSTCRPWRSAGKSSAIPGRRNASISASPFPSLEAPDAPKHVSADTVEESVQPIDRIFLSISAHHDTLAPDIRVRTIYPRYLEQASPPGQDGLTMRAFRDGTPYSNEDLFLAQTPEPQRALHARRRHPRHVPERAPHRRRRSDVSLSKELARAMARRRQCDGPPDAQLHGPKDRWAATVHLRERDVTLDTARATPQP